MRPNSLAVSRPLEQPVEVFEQVDHPVHADARLLLDFWREREAAGGFIVGRDVPSRALVRILYNLALFEPESSDGDVTDLRVRLAGDALRLRFGRNTAGARLSDLFKDDDFVAHLRNAKRVLSDGRAFILRSELRRNSLVERRIEVVILPVWNPQKTERWVLVGVFYFG